MNLILFSVTTFAVLDYFYRFMRFVSTDLAKIAKFLCFYSKSGLIDCYCFDFNIFIKKGVIPQIGITPFINTFFIISMQSKPRLNRLPAFSAVLFSR